MLAELMARFGTVPTSIWHPGSKFRHLSPGAQRLWLYLVTSPDRSVAGVQPYRPGKWAAVATGLTRSHTEAAATELADAGWVLIDYDTDELLVRWYMRETGVTGNPKWLKAVPDAMAAVESASIRQAVNAELASVGITSSAGAQPSLFGDVLPDGRPSDGVSDGVSQPPSDGGSPRARDRATYTHTYNQVPLSVTATTADLAAAFDAFWAVCPRKVGKGHALKAWPKAVKAAGGDPQVIIAAAKSYAEARSGQDPKFTKHPATWLNGQCWSDEPDPDQAAAVAAWQPNT